jgi:hypothetical protein
MLSDAQITQLLPNFQGLYISIFWITLAYFMLLSLIILVLASRGKKKASVVTAYIIGVFIYLMLMLIGYFNVGGLLSLFKI